MTAYTPRPESLMKSFVRDCGAVAAGFLAAGTVLLSPMIIPDVAPSLAPVCKGEKADNFSRSKMAVARLIGLARSHCTPK